MPCADQCPTQYVESGLCALRWNAKFLTHYVAVRADMVGHTGDLEACVGACSLVDKCVKELLDTVESLGGRWLLTADHGNADDMVQRAKKTNAPLFADSGAPLPLTSHTLVRAHSSFMSTLLSLLCYFFVFPMPCYLAERTWCYFMFALPRARTERFWLFCITATTCKNCLLVLLCTHIVDKSLGEDAIPGNICLCSALSESVM